MEFQLFIERVRSAGIKPQSRQKITANKMYPWGVERKLQHQLLQYFHDASDYYMEESLRGTSYAYDDVEDLTRSTFSTSIDINNIATEAGYAVQRFQQQSFENFTDVVIGARYIPASVNPSITKTWSDNFVNQCKSTTDEIKKKISSIVSSHLMQGGAGPSLRKQIQQACHDFSKGKAQLIARTETAKLNMAISKAQMEEAGIELYEWACVMDERSRKSHMAMDGKICSWNDPNVIYQKTTGKFVSRIQAAVHKHPGDDYNCRCIALPWDALIDRELNQKKGKPNKAWLEMQQAEAINKEKKKQSNKAYADLSDIFNNMRGNFLDLQKKYPEISLSDNFIDIVNSSRETAQKVRTIKNPHDAERETQAIMESIGVKRKVSLDIDNKSINPFYDIDDNYKDNCYNVVIAAEMRYRGYDVMALPQFSTKNGVSLRMVNEFGEPELASVFENAVALRFNSIKTIERIMSKWGDGARSIIGMQFENADRGHVTFAVQRNGKTVFEEYQSSRADIMSVLNMINFKDTSNYIMRVDNLAVTNLIKLAVSSPFKLGKF